MIVAEFIVSADHAKEIAREQRMERLYSNTPDNACVYRALWGSFHLLSPEALEIVRAVSRERLHYDRHHAFWRWVAQERMLLERRMVLR